MKPRRRLLMIGGYEGEPSIIKFANCASQETDVATVFPYREFERSFRTADGTGEGGVTNVTERCADQLLPAWGRQPSPDVREQSVAHGLTVLPISWQTRGEELFFVEDSPD